MRDISVEELAAIMERREPFTLLDVREDDEVRAAVIHGSVHVPMAQIPASIDALPAARPLVVLCHHGGRSARVAAFLEARGIDGVVNLEGGIDAWSQRVDPGVPRY